MRIELDINEVLTPTLADFLSALWGRKEPVVQVQPRRIEELPFMKWTQSVYAGVMRDIAAHKPEQGGILLGPVGERLASHFVFDETGIGTSASWTFGHAQINQLLKQYVPLGVAMIGYVHSHPSGVTSLSSQDLTDFRKPFLNAKNGDLTEILAPLVVDGQIYPYILYRDNPKPVLAQIILC